VNNLSRLSKKFENLINYIEVIKPGFLDIVGNGYSLDTIYSEFPDRKLPEGLVAIYLNIGSNIRARGGVGLSTFVPNYNIIPLFNIRSQLKIYEEQHEELLLQWGKDDWETDMISFLEDGCGCHYCVRSLENNQSVFYLDKVEDCSYKCHDLEAFFDMTYEMYKERAYYINEDEDFELDCDWDLVARIEEKYACMTL
jgi:hypothetical protein